MSIDWRDVLIVVGFVFAAFSYFRVTPKKLIKYTKIAKSRGEDVVEWVATISITGGIVYLISTILDTYEYKPIAILFTVLLVITICSFWYRRIRSLKQISDGKRTAYRRFIRYSVPSLLVTVAVLYGLESPIKAIYPLSGYFGTSGVLTLIEYIARKRGKSAAAS